MERTNWKFEEENINVIVLGIAYDHMSFPILFRLLPKRGLTTVLSSTVSETTYGWKIPDYLDLLVGIAVNLNVKAIRIHNNGRRVISLVKYSLDFIADALLNPFRPKINQCICFLSIFISIDITLYAIFL